MFRCRVRAGLLHDMDKSGSHYLCSIRKDRIQSFLNLVIKTYRVILFDFDKFSSPPELLFY